jgi:hypothetical protein
MFYDEDYIRLKGLAAMLPRAVVERILGRSLGPVPPERPDGRPAGGSAPRP